MADAVVKFVGKADFADVERRLRSLETRLKALGDAGKKGKKGLKDSEDGAKSFFDKILEGQGILGKFRILLVDAFIIGGVVSQFVGAIGRASQALAGLVVESQKVNIALTAADIKLKASTDGAQQLIAANLRLSEVTQKFGLDLLTTKEALAEFLAATRLSNLGFQERLAIFESLSQASRVFSLSQERVKLAFLAVTQIASKGALAMEEVRRQLGDQIPGVVPLLAEKLGVTVPRFFELVRDKAVSAEEGLRALRDGLNELTDEQAVIAGEILAASIGRLQKQVTLLKLAFGEATEGGTQEFIDQLERAAEALVPFSEQLGSTLDQRMLRVIANLTNIAIGLQ